MKALSILAIILSVTAYNYVAMTHADKRFSCSKELYHFEDNRNFVLCLGIDPDAASLLFDSTAFAFQDTQAFTSNNEAILVSGTAILVDKELNIVNFNIHMRER